MVSSLLDAYRVPIKRSCSVVGLQRSVWYYKAHGRDDTAIRLRIREIAEVRVRYGIERIFILLRREGWKDNHKRVYRIYKEEGLNLRNKRPRRNKSAAHRQERPVASTLHECWSMDFVSDQLFNGRRFRALTVVDNYSRKCLAIYANQSIKGQDVVNIVNQIVETEMSLPKRIQVDNGTEFISKALDRWAYENRVTLDFSRPGKPTDNPFIESFNGSFRDECLNVNWFLSLMDAQDKIHQWKWEYNHFRPHSSLNGMTPIEFESLNKIRNGSSDFAKVKWNDDSKSPIFTKSSKLLGMRSKTDSKNRCKLTPGINEKSRPKMPEISTFTMSD